MSDWPTSAANAGRPLSGVRVLDLSRVLAGPLCAMLLADLGADGVKVEPPAGDETRRWGPPFLGDTAAYYFSANRNKWNITLDLKQPEDHEIMCNLAATADVVIENYTEERAREFKLDYESIRAMNPDVVFLSITGFGDANPSRRGYDLLAQAQGGLMSVTGDVGSEGAKVGVPISDISAGLFGALGIVSALLGRKTAGGGRLIEVTLYDATLALLTNQAMSYLISGENPTRQGNDHPNVCPYGLYAADGGEIALAVATDGQFQSLCDVLGRRELCDDPRFRRNRDRVANRAALRVEIESVLGARSPADWSRLLDDRGIPNGAVRTLAEALTSREATSVTEVDSSVYGTVRQVLNPIRFDKQYLSVYLPPPAPDEHGILIRKGQADDE